MKSHYWEIVSKEQILGVTRYEEVLWRCRRCGFSFWTEGGTLAGVFHREDPDVDCDGELVRDVMES